MHEHLFNWLETVINQVYAAAYLVQAEQPLLGADLASRSVRQLLQSYIIPKDSRESAFEQWWNSLTALLRHTSFAQDSTFVCFNKFLSPTCPATVFWWFVSVLGEFCIAAIHPSTSGTPPVVSVVPKPPAVMSPVADSHCRFCGAATCAAVACATRHRQEVAIRQQLVLQAQEDYNATVSNRGKPPVSLLGSGTALLTNSRGLAFSAGYTKPRIDHDLSADLQHYSEIVAQMKPSSAAVLCLPRFVHVEFACSALVKLYEHDGKPSAEPKQFLAAYTRSLPCSPRLVGVANLLQALLEFRISGQLPLARRPSTPKFNGAELQSPVDIWRHLGAELQQPQHTVLPPAPTVLPLSPASQPSPEGPKSRLVESLSPVPAAAPERAAETIPLPPLTTIQQVDSLPKSVHSDWNGKPSGDASADYLKLQQHLEQIEEPLPRHVEVDGESLEEEEVDSQDNLEYGIVQTHNWLDGLPIDWSSVDLDDPELTASVQAYVLRWLVAQ
eukprot:TRINITY_DN26509_c0_g1_i1.p1 TRINITY_DN26509_c0_g1~~TRINITY_DN26509_c0_g1_i1.p1  ORF type:complete len:507 (+),score=59.43 TRINITY_DN26509_c0_g1_i1:25-1521(+)